MDSKDIYLILKDCSEASVILPVTTCFIRYKRFNAGLKIIAFYLFSSALVELISFILIHHFKHSNTDLLRLFTVIEFALLTLYFRTLFRRKALKWLLLAAIGSFGIIDIICAQFLQ